MSWARGKQGIERGLRWLMIEGVGSIGSLTPELECRAVLLEELLEIGARA